MEKRRQDLMLLVADGDPGIPRVLYYLDRLKRCDEILLFLVSQKLVGKKLAESIKAEHDNSILNLAKWALLKIDRALEVRPIIAGKDFIVK